MVSELTAFVGLSIVVICTPGPDTALTVRNAIVGGRSAGVRTAAGVATGQAVWTIAASVGVASLLSATEPAFVVLKVLGTGYLIYLGVQSLRAARAPTHEPPAANRTGRAYWQGLLNDLGNPKMAAFFLSMLPQFVPTERPHVTSLLGLGFLFSALTFGWLAGYSVAIGRARRLFQRARVRRAVDAVAGVALIGFGVRLALTQRAP
jgi:threonine/homoserine/homoserine lactone efflux protein